MLKLSKEEYVEKFIKPGIPHVFQSQRGNGEVFVVPTGETRFVNNQIEYLSFQCWLDQESFNYWRDLPEFFEVLDWFETTEKSCSCDLISLLQDGCNCGAIERYKCASLS